MKTGLRRHLTPGNAIALAARGVREKALRIAAEVLEASPEDLEIDEGLVQVRGVPGASIPLRTVSARASPTDALTYCPPANTFFTAWTNSSGALDFVRYPAAPALNILMAY